MPGNNRCRGRMTFPGNDCSPARFSRVSSGPSGPLETTSAVVYLGTGVRFAFELSGGWTIAPEVSYHYGLSDLTPGWRVHRTLVGLAVMPG